MSQHTAYDFGYSVEYIEVLNLIKSGDIKSIKSFDYPEKLTKVINYAASLGQFEIVQYLFQKGGIVDHIGFIAACLSGNQECIKFYSENLKDYKFSMPHILGFNHRDHNEYYRIFGEDKIKLMFVPKFIEYFEKNYTINNGDHNNLHHYVSMTMFYYNKELLNVKREPSGNNFKASVTVSDNESEKSLSRDIEMYKEEINEKDELISSLQIQLSELNSQNDLVIDLTVELKTKDELVQKLQKELTKKNQIIHKYKTIFKNSQKEQ
jgi:hypothetical protein